LSLPCRSAVERLLKHSRAADRAARGDSMTVWCHEPLPRSTRIIMRLLLISEPFRDHLGNAQAGAMGSRDENECSGCAFYR
jgi:hypothetical protein